HSATGGGGCVSSGRGSCASAGGSVMGERSGIGSRADGTACHSLQALIGTTFPGFDLPSGSNTPRNSHIAFSELGEKMDSMYPILSSPTPCSPVMLPPASMHACM